MSDHRLPDLNESPQPARAAIVCRDGFTMSVQASDYHYCTPRINDAPSYLEVEIGFPTERERLLDKYVEGFGLWVYKDDDFDFTSAVYPYVPAEVVIEVIMKHGGMVGGNLPNLDLSNLSNNEEE